MTASKPTYVFACDAAKISPLATDVAGSPATYGTGFYLSGVKKVTVTAAMDVKKLQANFKTLAVKPTLKDVTVDIEFMEFDPNVYALVTGALLTAGTGTAWTVGLNSSSAPAWFGLEALSISGIENGSNVSVFINKLIITEIPAISLMEEDFQPFILKCIAVQPIGTSNWIDNGYYPTAEVI